MFRWDMFRDDMFRWDMFRDDMFRWDMFHDDMFWMCFKIQYLRRFFSWKESKPHFRKLLGI